MTDKEVIALSYDGETTPLISAKTSGKAADDLLKLATEKNVYIHEDQELYDRLALLAAGEPIPAALFIVIAEILSYSYYLQGKTPEQWTRTDGTKAINLKS